MTLLNALRRPSPMMHVPRVADDDSAHLIPLVRRNLLVRNFKTTIKSALVALLMGALSVPAMTADAQALPDPDGKSADMSKPVKVFIIMGQSNTLEMGKVKGDENSLEHAVKTDGLYPFMVDDAGAWTTRKDVRNVSVMQKRGPSIYRNDWLTVSGGKIGIEQGIGHALGNHFDEPVMILKSSIGNRALGWDLLPPGSESFEFTDSKGTTWVHPGYKGSPEKWKKGEEPKPIGWYAGLQYDADTKNAKDILANLAKYYPEATKFEVVGFLWWQGDRDSRNEALSSRYEQNLAQLIKMLRKDFNAPNAKFVGASLGQTEKGSTGNDAKILDAVMNVANAEKYPDFKGDVAGVYTHPLVTPASSSGGHYGGSAKTYMNVGLAMGEAMVELFKQEKKDK